MHVYRNDVPALNEAPSLPIGLNAVVQPDNSVTLSWLPSTDDHTPGPAITYDLVIVRNGTHVPVGDLQKVGQDIITRLPEPGNISAVVEWSLAGLPDGQYQWQLRAVDAAYVGSQVAVGEFSIGVVSVDGDNELPFNFSLEQNYPNPFNPATTIKYSIPSSGQVTLKIYDALGEEVALLINEYRQAGNYILTFDGRNLSSGVYFYQLTSSNLIDTKKMILLR
ncbi:MAG: T9SS type A sorting domain-containing protein [bacterium]|nr:T9SS type A sorting domain-containing protein [bacterium]